MCQLLSHAAGAFLAGTFAAGAVVASVEQKQRIDLRVDATDPFRSGIIESKLRARRVHEETSSMKDYEGN